MFFLRSCGKIIGLLFGRLGGGAVKPLIVAILVLCLTIASVADETLYRYEGDVHPMDPSAGWVMGNPCDPPCSEFMEDGHFVRLWSEAADYASYAFRIAQPPDPPPPRCG